MEIGGGKGDKYGFLSYIPVSIGIHILSVTIHGPFVILTGTKKVMYNNVKNKVKILLPSIFVFSKFPFSIL